MPKNKQIAAKIDGITIGTFAEPPRKDDKSPAIIDIHNSSLIAIAPEESIESIVQAVDELMAPAEEPIVTAMAVPSPEPVPGAEPGPESVPFEKMAGDEGIFGESAVEAVEVEPNIPAEPKPKAKSKKGQEDFMQDQLFEALVEASEQQPEAEPVEPAEPEVKEPEQPKPKAEEPKADDAEKAELFKAIEALAAKDKEKTAQEAAKPEAEEIRRPKKVVKEEVQPAKEKPSRIETKPKEKPSELEPDIPDAEKELELTITLPEKIEISALLELVGKQLGLNYIYDPTKVQGSVMLKIHDGKIKVKDTYVLLESVLKFRGFVMTRRDNLVTIVQEGDVLKIDPKLRTPDEIIKPGDIIVSTVFKLEHVSTETAQKLLKERGYGTNFTAIPQTKTLIVTDYAFRMPDIQPRSQGQGPCRAVGDH